MHRDVITSVVYPTECTTSVALRWINKIRDNFTVFFMTVLNFWIYMQFRVIKCGLQPRIVRTPDFILLPWHLSRGLKLQKRTKDFPWKKSSS